MKRLLFLLSALLAVAHAAEECELGDDGTCLDKKECVDTHEKCGDWMETGTYSLERGRQCYVGLVQPRDDIVSVCNDFGSP